MLAQSDDWLVDINDTALGPAQDYPHGDVALVAFPVIGDEEFANILAQNHGFKISLNDTAQAPVQEYNQEDNAQAAAPIVEETDFDNILARRTFAPLSPGGSNASNILANEDGLFFYQSQGDYAPTQIFSPSVTSAPILSRATQAPLAPAFVESPRAMAPHDPFPNARFSRTFGQGALNNNFLTPNGRTPRAPTPSPLTPCVPIGSEPGSVSNLSFTL